MVERVRREAKRLGVSLEEYVVEVFPTRHQPHDRMEEALRLQSCLLSKLGKSLEGQRWINRRESLRRLYTTLEAHA
ncbi:MAG TPA: hypothetical protein EYH08_04655 [Pyrodictium sp.]|nr:hypothetical protein [Pyrodictium sp.]